MAGNLTIDFKRLADWALPRTGAALCQDMRAIGYERDGAIVAAFLFEGYDGPNIWTHAAFDSHGVPRTLLTAMLRYVFVELACQRVWARMCATNTPCTRFVEHLGARRMAVLPQADGQQDMCIYQLARRDVRQTFLNGRGIHHG